MSWQCSSPVDLVWTGHPVTLVHWIFIQVSNNGKDSTATMERLLFIGPSERDPSRRCLTESLALES